MYTIYSKDNCTYCTQAKALLERRGIQYREFKLGREFTRDEFVEQHPDVKSFPLVLDENDSRIGGFTELSKHLS